MTNDEVAWLGLDIAEPECFCDGNGSVPCWNGCDEGYLPADCGDDLCTGNECMHGLPDRPCWVCKGRGVINCPAHDDHSTGGKTDGK